MPLPTAVLPVPPGLPPMSLRALAAVLALTAAGAPAHAGLACDAALSEAQRTRFVMATEGCAPAAQPAPRPTELQADALVATAMRPVVASVEMPAREAAHLQLFGRPGVVTARVNPAVQPGWVQMGSARAAQAPARRTTGAVGGQRAVRLAPEIDAVARRHDIDPLLLHAIAWVESRHDPAATSRAGARGVMQVMPATGARFGVARADALHDVPINLDVSATYLKTLQQRYRGNLPLVLAAYNAGEGAVDRHGGRIPQYRETQDYVRQVLATYEGLTATATGSQAAR